MTKPIIDILVVLVSFGDEADWSEHLVDLGYDARGEYGIAGARYFSRSLAISAWYLFPEIRPKAEFKFQPGPSRWSYVDYARPFSAP